jgi:hypothetical protein
VAAKSQQARLIALNEGLKSGLVAAAGEGYEPLVALKPEQG